MTQNNSYKEYTDFIMDKTVTLLGIDSPTGYTENAAAWVKNEFEAPLSCKREVQGDDGFHGAVGNKLSEGLL